MLKYVKIFWVHLEPYLDTFNIFYSIIDYKLSRIVDDQGPSNIKSDHKSWPGSLSLKPL